MAREFEEFVLDGYNYPTWTIDVKITLTFRKMYDTIIPHAERQQELPPTH
jgi:hypothetical protein